MINVEAKDKRYIEYPCLMVADDGHVVLFTEYEVGTSLNAVDPAWYLGEHHTEFDMSCFKPFYGSITLSNKE